MRVTQCRVCENPDLTEVLDLGETPLANEFVEDPSEEEPEYPLRVVWCEECGLVLIDEVVPPEELFSNYVYVSGTSDRLRSHFDALVSDVVTRFDLDSDSEVLDIGSNDGTLLGRFKERRANVLGVEPATNIAEIAEENGIETINEFFSPDIATEIVVEYGKRDVITATNVFAHTHDVDSFLRGIDRAMADEGVFIIEVPYLVDLINKTEFDTVYHEHLSYFAVQPLKTLFGKHGFELIRGERVDIHGGSIRVFASKASASNTPDGSVEELVKFERRRGLNETDLYEEFASKVNALRKDLNELLNRLQAEGHTVAGYGAAAKGNTLLNYYEIGPDRLEFIADMNELKQGLYTPGTNIEVVPPSRIYEEEPDYLLILAWNFAEEIMEQQSEFEDRGGRFIIPVPDVEVV